MYSSSPAPSDTGAHSSVNSAHTEEQVLSLDSVTARHHMDKFLSTSMAHKQQRTRPERRQTESKMAAAAGPQAAMLQHEVTNCPLTTTEAQLGAEQHSPSSPVVSQDSPVTYNDVVRAVQATMTPLMEAHTLTLQQAVLEIKGQITQLSQAVSANECRLGEAFQDVSELKLRYKSLQKSYLQLNNKVDDLENRSRRCNLRVLGIPESVKGPELFKFLQRTLPELLNIQDICNDLVVERAHRLGPARSEADSKPRVVIFKSLSFIHKEAIWSASRKCKELRWNGSRLFIFQDYSAEVTRARKEFSPICTRLVKEGKKFALMFPARLRLFDGNVIKDFSSAADAEAYMTELREEVHDASSAPG